MIDGLQRLSTILEFMGLLKSPEGTLRSPSFLEATKYLPSLHNVVWQHSDEIDQLPAADQQPLEKGDQLAIRRARLSVEILKRPSDNETKFDLFQRLNAGGTQANAQELRNCIMLMVDENAFRSIKKIAEEKPFLEVIGSTKDQIEKQRHMEFAVRFLVHTNVPYDGILDVEEYIDEGIIKLLNGGKIAAATKAMEQTFSLLQQAAGGDALKRFDGKKHVGKVGLVGLEGIAVGIAKNLVKIKKESDPLKFIQKRLKEFWAQPSTDTFTSPGLRGTIRIERTVPFGAQWFQP